MTPPPTVLFGVPIDRLSMTEVVDELGRMVAAGRAAGTTHQVATVNVDFLVNAFGDRALHALLGDADLCVGDGMPVLWAARLAGQPLPSRVTGVDLIPALAERSATTGWRIHMFGGAPGIAGRAAQLLNDRFPGAQVTGWSGPTIGDVTAVGPEVIDALRDADADILCVALGNPKQEHFIAANRERLGVPVLIGVGGTLDLLVGERRRAPRWVQRVGLEWVFRAIQEPRRLGRRYARDIFIFLPRAARFILAVRPLRSGSDLPAPTTAPDGATVIDLAGVERLSLQGLGRLALALRTARQTGGSVRLEHVDPALLAELRRFAPAGSTAAAEAAR